MQAQSRHEGFEDVPGAPEGHRTGLLREDAGRPPESRIRGNGAPLGDREIQLRHGQDALADQTLHAGIADEAQFADAPEQKRKADQSSNSTACTAARYLMKSTEMVAGAFAVMVVVTLRSPNCGFLNTISRTPSRMAMFASGVSPALSPSV